MISAHNSRRYIIRKIAVAQPGRAWGSAFTEAVGLWVTGLPTEMWVRGGQVVGSLLSISCPCLIHIGVPVIHKSTAQEIFLALAKQETVCKWL